MATKRKRRVQIVKQYISESDLDYEIDVELDHQYEKVKRIYAYADPNYTSNNNVVFTKGLKINNVEHFPDDFDGALLFPVDHNDEFTKIDEEAAGSRLQVTVKDTGTVSSAYYFTFVLILENE